MGEPREWTQEEIDVDYFLPDDDEPDDGIESGEACGRWRNGKLAHHCLKAGGEECDWECPYGYRSTRKQDLTHGG